MAAPSLPIIDQWPTCLQTSIQFWWRPPAVGTPLTNYTLACAAISYTQSIAGDITNYTVTGLTAGTEYTFTITATNGTGVGPVATFPRVAVGLPPFGPTQATASTINNTTALVSWLPSTIANQAPTRWYVITGLPSSSSASSFYKTQQSHLSSLTISGLSTNTFYSFLVQAVASPGYCIPFAYTSTVGVGTNYGLVQEGLILSFTATSYSGSGEWVNQGTFGTGANASATLNSATKTWDGNGIILNGTNLWRAPPTGTISFGTFTSYTITVWFKRTVAASFNDTILSAFTGTSSGIAFYLTRRQLDADTEFRIATYDGSTVTLGTKYSYPLNTWVSFTATHSGSSIITYINGSSIGTVAAPVVPSMGGGVFIGHNGGGNNAIGELGQVLIYNRVLNSSDVAANFTAMRSIYNV